MTTKSVLAKVLSSTVGAAILAFLSGPANWYLTHGIDPIVNPAYVWPLFFFAPAAVVGLFLGIVHGNGWVTGPCFSGSMILVFYMLAFCKVSFFCDGDLGCFTPVTIALVIFNFLGMIGLAFGCNIHSLCRNGNASV